MGKGAAPSEMIQMVHLFINFKTFFDLAPRATGSVHRRRPGGRRRRRSLAARSAGGEGGRDSVGLGWGEWG